MGTMKELLLINPLCREVTKAERLNVILQESLEGENYKEIITVEELIKTDLRNRRILFTISLGESGINLEFFNMLKAIRLNQNCFFGSVAGVIVDGANELFTKSIARELVYSANRSGCAFPGRPLVEATKSLKNFNIQAQNLNTDNMGAYMVAGKNLVKTILSHEPILKEKPRILMVHSGERELSNTLTLWDMVKKHLDGVTIDEISIRNGQVLDCRGCPYETCLHFSEEGSCFYGGKMVKEIYPAILECDALVMVCPNYNDAVSANLTAFINRLTALVVSHKFYKKSLFGIVVSGYSGGDIVAEQLISALNMNKTFRLPGKFSLVETANDAKAIYKVADIEVRAKEFAENILANIRVKGCQKESF